MKLLEEYAEGKSSWQLFLKCDTRSISFAHTKEDKLDFIKIKNFCISKYTLKRLKRKPTEWREYLQSYT